ncbi:hypothetical protein C8R44DRAFT_888081 [Mycena epipterygia]|nr:hypothetical protein C8R44DRAFT_888081 [Mycena epipterygia]
MYSGRQTPAPKNSGHRANNLWNPTPRTNGSCTHNASNSTSNSDRRSGTTWAPMSDATNHGPRDSDRGRSVQAPPPSNHYDNSDAERSPSPTEQRRRPENAGAKRRQPASGGPFSDQENGHDHHASKRSRTEQHTQQTGESTQTESDSDTAPDDSRLPYTFDRDYKMYITRKGRFAGRYVDFFAPWADVLAIGLKRKRRDDPDKFTDQQNRNYDTFKALEELIPELHDEMVRLGSTNVVQFARALQEGRKSAHATDVNTIKQRMIILLDGHQYNPATKHLMGFKNARCAALNCPADLSIATDLDYRGNPGLLEKLKAGTLALRPQDLSKGLFHREEVDLNNLAVGFLKHELLSYIAVFIAPSSASDDGGGNKGTVKGNAARHEKKSVSLPSIYYVAELNHFAFSSQVTYNSTGGHGQFNYGAYYQAIQKTVMLWPEQDIKDLLQWKVFPEAAVDEITKRPDGSLSIAQRMQAQVQVARDEADRLAEARAQDVQAFARAQRAQAAQQIA